MIPRFAKISGIVAAVAALFAAACVDMSAPKNVPSSVSTPQLPAMFVVLGDLMRDSLGNPAKPFMQTYDGSGNPVQGYTPTFFLTDSNPAAHFNADGVLVGDRFGVVHLVGQIGNIQTTALQVAVTVAPDTIIASKPDTLRAPVGGSDTTKSMGFQSAAATVKGGTKRDSVVPGVIVRYTLVHAPESSSPTQPAVYLTDDSGNLSAVDTSDVSGLVSRRVVLVSTRLKDPNLLGGQTTDSVVVEARAKYRGGDLAGSPLRLVMPVKVTFALK